MRRTGWQKEEKEKNCSTPGFPHGPPPQYWLGDMVLDFAEQTGCGTFTTLWPQMEIDLCAKISVLVS